MTSPYPQSGPVVTGLYQTKQSNAGVPAGPSVFAALYQVQSTTIGGQTRSGATAEAGSATRARAKGTITANGKGALSGAKQRTLVSRNADFLRDFYDSSSITD
jgi:hypothetical protein